jgi:hypothetical protein
VFEFARQERTGDERNTMNTQEQREEWAEREITETGTENEQKEDEETDSVLTERPARTGQTSQFV